MRFLPVASASTWKTLSLQLTLNRELVTEEEQKDLDHLGIAKNAREEKLRARDDKMAQAQDAAHNERMAKLYREVVLKEKQPEGFIPLASIAPVGSAEKGSAASSKSNAKSSEEVGEPVMGD